MTDGPVPRRPNVLLVTVDQWPGPLLGCEDHPVIETPTLDALAAAGTRFVRAYSECPICIPARRSLMTGTTPRTHGDRLFQPALPMPAHLPTLPAAFRAAGYQTFAVGKLHVYPPRDRIGFDDALIAEEGRPQLGAVDDHDLYLAARGFAGQGFAHGMSNNDYGWRSFHLPEDCHVTNWATDAMCRTIKRRDPTRPAFWYLSYAHPHPPLVPLASYFERYARRPVPPALSAPWADEEQPHALAAVRDFWARLPPEQLTDARRAFYALCTHIDAQLRLVIGTLREEQVLDDTVILFTGDHGDMLGDFGLYAKRLMYEGACRVPMILLGCKDDERVPTGRVDRRLVGLRDVMPTLLDLAGIEPPATCEGISMVGERRRDTCMAEALEGPRATRMMTDGRHKLIWYPDGNAVQLFDLDADPQETADLSADPAHREIREALSARLASEVYGEDENAVCDGRLVGRPATAVEHVANRGLSGQRGLHYPQPPMDDPSRVVGSG